MSAKQLASCEGKFPFRSWTLAAKAASRRRGVMPYRCPCCGAWHVGGRK
jgi:hypothetical protein